MYRLLALLAWGLLCWSFPGFALAATNAGLPSVVTISKTDKGWQLRRNDVPYDVHGVGYARTDQLELLKKSGGTTIRTWSADAVLVPAGQSSLLDRAQKEGITVMIGLAVGAEKNGFDYADQAALLRQREQIISAVRSYKTHPALLLWGLGNEMEGRGVDGGSPAMWRELNHLATLIKAEDPHHPIVTAIAGLGQAKIDAVIKYYPALDVLGLNVYGGAASAGARLAARGWVKPFMLTEYGPTGPWETAKTPWGAPIEQSSEAKAESYLKACQAAQATPFCVGTFAFLWGESGPKAATRTWFGLLLGNEKLPAVDTLTFAWTGSWPKNRSPIIESCGADFIESRTAKSKELNVIVQAHDSDGDTLSYAWEIQPEREKGREDGDKSIAPRSHTLWQEGNRAKLQMPESAGAYRLFCTVRDGKGGATVRNIAFFVE
jgi:hypothetical protein